MIWLVDAGNTRVKVTARNADGQCGDTTQVAYADVADWVAGQATNARVIVSCVAGNQHLEQLQAQLPAHSEWVQTPREGLGIQCAYADNRKWGVDRWLALAAVHAEAPAGQGSAVVDIGTATTFDLCDARGHHQGGWIAPGPLALMQALGNGRTALPQATEELPEQVGLAIDTEDALLHGALHCALGSIRAAAASAAEHGVSEIVLAGGGAPLLSPYLPELCFRQEQELVTRGLALYAAAVQLPSAT